MVHVADKPSQDHQPDMEYQVTDQQKEMDGSGCLPPPNSFGYQGNRLTTAGDIAMPLSIESGAMMNTTAKYASCCNGL
jgi:hypothetical protein